MKSLYVRVAVAIGVVDVKPTIRFVVRMERNTQHSLFAAASHARRNIEKRHRQQSAILDDSNSPGLLDNKKSIITRR
jgi:hypothetical protein